MKCETHILTDTINLYVAKGHGSGSVAQGNSANLLPWSIQSRGPWLLNRLCCPVESSLTMTSSETLATSCRLIFFVLAGLCLAVSFRLATRGSPIYSAYLFHRATSGTPALRSATNDRCITNRYGLHHLRSGSAHARPYRRFSYGSCNEAASSSLSLRPDGLLALHRQGRLLSSFRLVGHPK
jgi:hypothetical protein